MKLICDPACDTGKNNLNGKGGTLLTAIVVLLLPKCAFCWAAYMQMLSYIFMIEIPYSPWFLPVSIILFSLMLAKLLYQAIYVRNFTSFALAFCGGLLIILNKVYVLPGQGLKYLAVIMLVSAMMIDNIKLLHKSFTAIR